MKVVLSQSMAMVMSEMVPSTTSALRCSGTLVPRQLSTSSAPDMRLAYLSSTVVVAGGGSGRDGAATYSSSKLVELAATSQCASKTKMNNVEDETCMQVRLQHFREQ